MNQENETESSRADRAKQFSLIWVKSRAEAGKSQEYMSMNLGVSKKTIQNWEKGVSSPSFFQSTEWFRVLGLNPLSYYLEYIYSGSSSKVINTSSKAIDRNNVNESDLDNTLLSMIESMPIESKEELLFLFSGLHGSSPYSVLHLLTAHLQTPLKDRVAHASIIMQDYEMEKHLGNLTAPDHAQPDLDLLEKSIHLGKKSAISGQKAYSIAHEFRKTE